MHAVLPLIPVLLFVLLLGVILLRRERFQSWLSPHELGGPTLSLWIWVGVSCSWFALGVFRIATHRAEHPIPYEFPLAVAGLGVVAAQYVNRERLRHGLEQITVLNLRRIHRASPSHALEGFTVWLAAVSVTLVAAVAALVIGFAG